MTPIQKALTAIRERQSKATPGKWVISNADWRKNVKIPLVTEIVREYSPITPLVTVSFTAWRPERGKTCQANAEYIAQACSPEGGDVSRLLGACEIMAETLRKLDLGIEKHPMTAAREARAKATAILEGSGNE